MSAVGERCVPLPCPCCKGEPAVKNFITEAVVSCAVCRLAIIRRHRDCSDDTLAVAEAVAAWNRRAPQSGLEVAAAEQMREAAAKCVEAWCYSSGAHAEVARRMAKAIRTLSPSVVSERICKGCNGKGQTYILQFGCQGVCPGCGGKGVTAALTAPVLPDGVSARRGIYTASKTKHAWRWRELRRQGVPIISTWIDEAGESESASLSDLWQRCIRESASCEMLLLYAEPGDALKGAHAEAGVALSHGIPVHYVGPPGMFTILNHPGICRFDSVDAALAARQDRDRGEG